MLINNNGWKAVAALLSLIIVILLSTVGGETYYLYCITTSESNVNIPWSDSMGNEGTTSQTMIQSPATSFIQNDDDDSWASTAVIPKNSMFGSDSPWSQINRMQKQMDKMFSKPFRDLPDEQLNPLNMTMSDMKLEDDADHYVVRMALAYSEKFNVKVKVDGRLLTVTGEQDFSKATENKDDSLDSEQSTAEFSESLELPGDVNSKLMQVKFDKNVLLVTLPKVK